MMPNAAHGERERSPAAGLAAGYRGLLALDVDGPLNPYGAKACRRPEGYKSFRLTRDGRWYTGSEFRKHKGLCVWLNPSHGRLILDLADRTGLRPVWATTWQEEANKRIAPVLGLPELPVIVFPDKDDDWKYGGVAAAAAGAPLAWIDDFDDASWEASRAAFAHDRAWTPTLLCAVDPAIGLQPSHCDAVERWAETF